MNTKPKTVEELAALPEGPAFGRVEEIGPTGKTIVRPVAPEVEAVFHEEA